MIIAYIKMKLITAMLGGTGGENRECSIIRYQISSFESGLRFVVSVYCKLRQLFKNILQTMC
jgi:hypothetical protein